MKLVFEKVNDKEVLLNFPLLLLSQVNFYLYKSSITIHNLPQGALQFLHYRTPSVLTHDSDNGKTNLPLLWYIKRQKEY